ncbi:MAG: MerC domain-containing protein [Gemmatimonadales bacterium]|nr:MAG: MerC domain-containing protein [Gemmatimonadales bacterium]
MFRQLVPHPWGWASLAPALCALHCASAPLLILLAPAVVENPAVEFGMLGVTVVVAVAALFLGVRRHGSPRPIVPVLVGILAWWASLSHVFHPVSEELTTALAAMVVAGGLIWNARLHCTVADSCGSACTSCEEEAKHNHAAEGTLVADLGAREALRVADIDPSPAIRS